MNHFRFHKIKKYHPWKTSWKQPRKTIKINKKIFYNSRKTICLKLLIKSSRKLKCKSEEDLWSPKLWRLTLNPIRDLKWLDPSIKYTKFLYFFIFKEIYRCCWTKWIRKIKFNWESSFHFRKKSSLNET